MLIKMLPLIGRLWLQFWAQSYLRSYRSEPHHFTTPPDIPLLISSHVCHGKEPLNTKHNGKSKERGRAPVKSGESWKGWRLEVGGESKARQAVSQRKKKLCPRRRWILNEPLWASFQRVNYLICQQLRCMRVSVLCERLKWRPRPRTKDQGPRPLLYYTPYSIYYICSSLSICGVYSAFCKMIQWRAPWHLMR